jgi:hypothetical protein
MKVNDLVILLFSSVSQGMDEEVRRPRDAGPFRRTPYLGYGSAEIVA